MEIITKLKLIKKQCEEHRHGCDNCPYENKYHTCKVKEAVYEMCKSPALWDIEQIEGLLK